MATQREFQENTKGRIREPKQYHVIMLNDDFTSMEFVVQILMDIFHKDALSAETIMLGVHRSGRAIVGTYSYDIASTKVNAATARAKAEGYPFRMLIEEA